MIVGYHVIFSAYGFWLPNDPRGSWSEFVGAWELVLAGGRTTKTDERCSLARRPHDRKRRLTGKAGGFACNACHAIADVPAQAAFEAPAPNFAHTRERIRKDYYLRWTWRPLRACRPWCTLRSRWTWRPRGTWRPGGTRNSGPAPVFCPLVLFARFVRPDLSETTARVDTAMNEVGVTSVGGHRRRREAHDQQRR